MSELKKKQVVSEGMTFEKDDKLNRKSIAENFNLILGKTSQSFVIALDSPWGTGKTQFIHMWKNLLGEKKVESIYLNLWEEDFLGSPFFSLTESLLEKFKQKKIDDLKKIKENIKKIGLEIGRAGVNKFTGVDIKDIYTENLNKKTKKKKKEFKDNLRKLSKKIKTETKFPLIIFVDELDRCRPDYAVEFLEVIKHFFDVENIIFVLGIDRNQLQYSVASLYGQKMDAKGYLRKFIDINYSFSEFSLDEYLNFLFSEFGCGKKQDQQIYMVKEIIKEFNPSLREIDQLFTRLKLIEKDINLSYIQASFFLAFKNFKEEEYDKLMAKQYSTGAILNLMKYFESRNSNIGKITFWKIANDLILRSSDTEVRYLNNLKEFFSKLASEWIGIKDILKSFDNFKEVHYCWDSLLEIFLEENGVMKQPNITTIKNIFRSRNSLLKEFNELIQKIEFLEGLDFGKEVENEK